MKELARRQVVLWSGVLTFLVNAITAFFRFGLGLQSVRDTPWVLVMLTGGVHVHHGYIGILLFVAALALGKARPAVSRWILVIAITLLCSDLMYHFLVLWPIVGNPGFQFLYPRT